MRKFVRKWRKGDREFTETKVWKLQKKREECPVLGCDGELIFMGYPVWVDRVDKEGDIVGGMFRMGTKTKRLEKRYCKTIKARDALVNKLVEKYSSKK
uniref:Uncharacterized protein n=1 Tax=Caldisericum exile TaxID=693075 RepID=A0A7C4Y755_9BACT